MMKFENPFFRSAVEIKVDTHTPTVVAWLESQSSNRMITLAELRAGLPAIAADLTRQVVNQICHDIGAHIENTDDTSQ